MASVSNTQINGKNAILLDSGAGLQATILPDPGGICSSLRYQHKGQWIELLYEPNAFTENGMGGRIPILFPVVGRLRADGKADQYRHKGAIYQMEGHGFARVAAWELADSGADEKRAFATIELKSNEQTLGHYPYAFCLRIEYAVTSHTLTMHTTVKNESSEPMPFSYGPHPYFKAPLIDGLGSREACLLRVPGKTYYEMVENIPTGRILPLEPPFNALPQGMPVCDEEKGVIVGNLQTAPDGKCHADFIDPASGITISQRFDPKELETVTLYSPPGKNFACLEPRTGIPMSISDDSKAAYEGKIAAPGQTISIHLDFVVEESSKEPSK